MTLTKTQRKIVRTIQQLHQRRAPLNITAIKRLHPELMETVYAVKPFWGWKRALEDAGIDYQSIEIELQQRLECEICHQWKINLASHICCKHQIEPDEYRSDYPDAEMLSEQMRATMLKHESSRIPHWEPLWSREYVLDRLAEYRRRGLLMHCSQAGNNDNALLMAANRYWEGWDNALRAIGVDPKTNTGEAYRLMRNYPDRMSVLAAIKRRMAEGLSLNCSHLLKHRNTPEPHADQRLYVCAKTYFGSWPRALRAAGFNPAKLKLIWNVSRTYPTRESVRQEILARVKSGWPVNHGSLYIGPRRDHPLAKYACQYFGSWRHALRATGIDPNTVTQQAIAKHKRYPDRQAVIDGICRRYRAGRPLNVMRLCNGPNRDSTLLVTARIHYGSWDEALRAAGLDPTTVRKQAVRACVEYPTCRSIVKAIQAMAMTHQPLNSSTIKRNNQRFHRRTVRLFGSWLAALRAAGIDPQDVKRQIRANRILYPTPDTVIHAIQCREQKGQPLNCAAVCKEPPANVTLWTRAKEHFGSWDNALRAAGIDPKNIARALYLRHRRYPDKESVLKAIAQRALRGLPLNTLAVWKGTAHDVPLWNSASDYFGSWDRALEGQKGSVRNGTKISHLHIPNGGGGPPPSIKHKRFPLGGRAASTAASLS